MGSHKHTKMAHNQIAVLVLGFLLTTFLCHFVDAGLSFMQPGSGPSGSNEVILKSNAFEGFLTPNTVDFESESPYIPVINLFEADLQIKDDFNVCDESTYPTSGLSFNKTLNITNADQVSTTRWAALWTSEMPYAPERCPKGLPRWMRFVKYQAKRAQQLGASAMIYYYHPVIGLSEMVAHHKPPHVDAVERIVEGIKITIPTIVLIATKEDYLALFDPKVEQVWLKSSSITDTDANWVDELATPFGYFMISTWLFILYNVYLIYIIVNGIKDQRIATRDTRNSAAKRVATMRYLVLVPELFKCIISIVYTVDPINVLNVPGYNYIDSSILSWIVTGMSNFTDITMSFYCYEIYRVFKSTENMQKNTSLSEKCAWIAPCIITAASVIVGVRVYVIWFYYYGESTDMTLYNYLLLYTLLTSFIAAVYLNCLSCRTRKLIKKVIKRKSDKNDGTTSAKSDDRTARIATMNGYMIKASLGFVLYIVFLTSYAFAGNGALGYAVSQWLSHLSSVVGSTYQIFGAIFMIPKSAEKKDVKKLGDTAKKTGDSIIKTLESRKKTGSRKTTMSRKPTMSRKTTMSRKKKGNSTKGVGGDSEMVVWSNNPTA